jgi:hypothetical protein
MTHTYLDAAEDVLLPKVDPAYVLEIEEVKMKYTLIEETELEPVEITHG